MTRKKTPVADGDALVTPGAPDVTPQDQSHEHDQLAEAVGPSNKPGTYRMPSGATLIRN